MSSQTPLPFPVPTPDNHGFWEACKRHELVIQTCSECHALRHPPRPICPQCHSGKLRWKPVTGMGTLYTYTITHQAIHSALQGRIPWTVIIVELDEGVRMISHLVDCPEEKLRVGLRVVVTFEDINEDISLPYFRPQDS